MLPAQLESSTTTTILLEDKHRVLQGHDLWEVVECGETTTP